MGSASVILVVNLWDVRIDYISNYKTIWVCYGRFFSVLFNYLWHLFFVLFVTQRGKVWFIWVYINAENLDSLLDMLQYSQELCCCKQCLCLSMYNARNIQRRFSPLPLKGPHFWNLHKRRSLRGDCWEIQQCAEGDQHGQITHLTSCNNFRYFMPSKGQKKHNWIDKSYCAICKL